MKNYLLICFIFFANVLIAQNDDKPDGLFQTVTGADNSAGSFSQVALTDKGVFKTVRVQAATTQSPAYWLFNDEAGDFSPKWAQSASGTITINQKNTGYAILNGGTDGEINTTAGKYYTFIIQNVTNANADMSVIETDFVPQTITNVTTPNSTIINVSTTVEITIANALNANEKIWLRYTTNAWATSQLIQATATTATNYEVTIPGQSSSTTIEYYVLSTLSGVTPTHSDADYLTLELNNNGGANYTYLVENPPSSTNAPVIDGVFDGTTKWGNAVATSDGVVGWDNVNVGSIYVTNDDNYYYFGAVVTASDWMDWGFVINTQTGGGSTEPWGRSITFAHTDLPDYVIKGHFGDPNDDGSNSPYAELRTWNSGTSSWDSKIYTSLMAEDETQFIEIKILKADLGNATVADIQFYITGNSGNHGTFDACPNDENADVWDESASPTVLDNYQTNVPLPVELAFFKAIQNENTIDLHWQTLSELNNRGFDIQKSVDGKTFETLAFVEGKGNSLETIDYHFKDKNPNDGLNYYRLKQMDFDGAFEFSAVVVVDLKKENTFIVYPNPTAENLTIKTDFKGLVQIFIYNINGQIVYQNTQPMNNQMEINLGDLVSGNYHLVIANSETEAIIYSGNIVKK